ncbi:DUF4236 domain-containing protein [Rhizobium beringeri]|uniref:DUF4236 domain-containing protein n=1 Tax=Rhizobium beringeri TaxID=3019934 RepID=UPI002E1266EB|nr:DUF4236 domain-containing protein [Rhizobium beringeri]
MPFYIRKPISAGPFRFNFSKGGVRVSVGVKGLRIGTGPRGHYIHAGRGGLYYRASLGNAGRREAPAAPAQPSPRSRIRKLRLRSCPQHHDIAFSLEPSPSGEP